MTTLLTCTQLSKSFGVQRLFEGLSFSLHSGDRLGIIGPNGSGKSTLLKILCQLEDADAGDIYRAKFCRIQYLAQQDTFDDAATINENLYMALAQEELEEVEKYTAIHSMLSRAAFPDTNMRVGDLSGGWRKRLAICRAMLCNPDVLVMDEPTNHLDIEGILWLEKMLIGMDRSSAWLVVSHDRRFLENCTNRIMELSAVYPEGSLQVAGTYSTFLEKREMVVAGQQEEEGRLANKARREIEWLRRGPKARATKAKYRIDEAARLRNDLAEVKSRNRVLSSVEIDFSATGRKTKKLLEMTALSKSWEGQQLFSRLDLVLSPGSRLGLLGRNGCGKSTLMRILAGGGEGDVVADSGDIRIADKVQIVHFDQKREGLDPELPLRRALAPDGDAVVFHGRSVHVVSWAKKFLFRPEQLETPVGQLSGGERARILIAQLMRQPADILLLDEPTNDLDIASLDVLEASLMDFPGALVLVSHDRFLLDRVCDRLLGFDGCGEVRLYADYQQWLKQMEQREESKKSVVKQGDVPPPEVARSVRKGRLSYLDQREYDQLEETLAAAETLVEELEAEMATPEVAADPSRLDSCWQRLEEAKKEVDRLYLRWEELEIKRDG